VVVGGRARVRRVRRAPAAAEGRRVGANDAHGGGPGRGQAAGATAAAQEGAARGGGPAAAARTVGPVREEVGVCVRAWGATRPRGAHAASLSLSLWRPASPHAHAHAHRAHPTASPPAGPETCSIRHRATRGPRAWPAAPARRARIQASRSVPLPPHSLLLPACASQPLPLSLSQSHSLPVVVPVRLEAAVADGRDARRPPVILLEAEHALQQRQAARVRPAVGRDGPAGRTGEVAGWADTTHARAGG